MFNVSATNDYGMSVAAVVVGSHLVLVYYESWMSVTVYNFGVTVSVINISGFTTYQFKVTESS